MVTFEDFIAAGTALARSIGHKNTCIKHSSVFPSCNCGSGAEQAKALDDWQHLMNDESRRESTEFSADWEKARSGEISFKTFADKWLPYVKEVDTKLGL
jgi:hypothetical protein